jgi:hypothetical protein
MSGIIRSINHRRAIARDERRMWRVINSTGSPAMRDELIVMHQHQLGRNR